LAADAEGAWLEAPAVAGGDTLTIEISCLTATTKYAAQICAVNSVGESPFSELATATTLAAAVVAPAAPEIVNTVSNTPHSIDVTWKPPADTEVTGFELQYRKVGDDKWAPDVPVKDGTTVNFCIPKLKSNTKYEWRVMAKGPGGQSEWTDLGRTTTQMSVKEKLHEVMIEMDAELGDSCPDIDVDVEKMKIILNDEINFKGGKAVIMDDDLHVQAQLEKTIVTLYKILMKKGYDMFHIRFDGHVHPTGKDMRCLVISYFRAAELVRRVVKAGCPGEFLHAYGYGQRMPVTSDKKHADLNRRVEINFLDHHHIEQMDADACQLWAEIRTTDEFKKFTNDGAAYGDPDHNEDMKDYAPHGANPI